MDPCTRFVASQGDVALAEWMRISMLDLTGRLVANERDERASREALDRLWESLDVAVRRCGPDRSLLSALSVAGRLAAALAEPVVVVTCAPPPRWSRRPEPTIEAFDRSRPPPACG